MTDYYGMRWQIVRDYMAESWDGMSNLPSPPPYNALVKAATKAWTEGDGKTAQSYPNPIKNYPATATGDPLKISSALYLKYSPLFSEFYGNSSGRVSNLSEPIAKPPSGSELWWLSQFNCDISALQFDSCN